MADADLLASLNAKVVAYESAGMTDHVKRVKARIAQLEKADKAPALAPAKKAAAKKTTARKATKTSAAAKKSAATRAAKKSKET